MPDYLVPRPSKYLGLHAICIRIILLRHGLWRHVASMPVTVTVAVSMLLILEDLHIHVVVEVHIEVHILVITVLIIVPALRFHK